MKLQLFTLLLQMIFISVHFKPATNINIFSVVRRNIEKKILREQTFVAENFNQRNKQRITNEAKHGEKYVSQRRYDMRMPSLLKITPQEQKSNDTFYFEFIKDLVKALLSPIIDLPTDINWAKKTNKLQEATPSNVSFPCDVSEGRSKERPTSVHQVRPGDIDLVVAMGDSLINGNGIGGASMFSFFWASSHIAGAIGGWKTWREFLTIPNILKEFNPNLIGYAISPTFHHTRIHSKVYNFASPGAFVDDMVTQARTFVKKMREDPRVDFYNDWKMVTMLVGGIDICQDMCHWRNPYKAVQHQKKTLEKAFDYLMAHSPRTIVNLIAMPNVGNPLGQQKGLSMFCNIVRSVACPCYYAGIFKENAPKYHEFVDEVITMQRAVANDPKYQQKEDFAVLDQPILFDGVNFTRTTPQGNTTDFRYFGPDCFHFSQRGHAAAQANFKEGLLSELSKETQCDILLIQETHRGPNASKPVVKGMKLVIDNPHEQYGSAIFVKPNITVISTKLSRVNNIEILTINTNHVSVSSVYKPSGSRFVFPTSYLDSGPNIIIGDFNCQSTSWGYAITNDDGKLLEGWTEGNSLSLIYDAKLPASFNSGRWKKGYNPDNIFVYQAIWHTSSVLE